MQGRGEASRTVLDQALLLEKAGAFAIVLEAIPVELGTEITSSVQVPTIGIGAGTACDAQVLVVNDLLGLSERLPKLAKAYADLRRRDLPGGEGVRRRGRARNLPGRGPLLPTSPRGRSCEPCPGRSPGSSLTITSSRGAR